MPDGPVLNFLTYLSGATLLKIPAHPLQSRASPVAAVLNVCCSTHPKEPARKPMHTPLAVLVTGFARRELDCCMFKHVLGQLYSDMYRCSVNVFAAYRPPSLLPAALRLMKFVTSARPLPQFPFSPPLQH